METGLQAELFYRFCAKDAYACLSIVSTMHTHVVKYAYALRTEIRAKLLFFI